MPSVPAVSTITPASWHAVEMRLARSASGAPSGRVTSIAVDPADATGTPAEIALAFKHAYRLLNQRIGIFTALPLRSLDKLSLQSKLRDIGHIEGSTAKVTEAT